MSCEYCPANSMLKSESDNMLFCACLHRPSDAIYRLRELILLSPILSWLHWCRSSDNIRAYLLLVSQASFEQSDAQAHVVCVLNILSEQFFLAVPGQGILVLFQADLHLAVMIIHIRAHLQSVILRSRQHRSGQLRIMLESETHKDLLTPDLGRNR